MPKIETLTERNAREVKERAHARAFEDAKNAVGTATAAVPKAEQELKRLDAQAKVLASVQDEAKAIAENIEVSQTFDSFGALKRVGGNCRFVVLSVVGGGAEIIERQRAEAAQRLKDARASLVKAKATLAEFD